MFCSQCGNEIKQGSSFCTKCGKRLVSAPSRDKPAMQAPIPPAAPKAPAPPSTETAEWVFSAQRKLSVLKMIPCNIVFMQDKAVFAYLTPALTKAENAKVSNEIKAEGAGFFKGSAAMLRFWSGYHKKYYSMTADAILAEDPSNIAVQYQNITGVLFKGFSDNTNFDDASSNVTQGKLNFSLAGGETLKFVHSQTADRSVQDILARLFGGKLKYKR